MNGRRVNEDSFHQPAQQSPDIHHGVGQDHIGRRVEPLQLLHKHGVESFVVPPGRSGRVVGRRSGGGGRGRGGGGEGRGALKTAAVIQQLVVALLDELLRAREHALEGGERCQDRALHAVFLVQETPASLIVPENDST